MGRTGTERVDGSRDVLVGTVEKEVVEGGGAGDTEMA